MVRFLKLSPPRFAGNLGDDPHGFTSTVERSFEVMELTDEAARIRLASFLLDGRAARWWQERGAQMITTWDEFKSELTLSVLPRSERDRKADQFYEFTQEPGMSVSEYEDRFRDLSRYAPAEARGEEALARKFLNGLLLKHRRVVATLGLSTVSQISEAARGMEYQDERQPREPKRAKTEGTSVGQQGRGQSVQSEQRRRHSSRGQRQGQGSRSASGAQPAGRAGGQSYGGSYAQCETCGKRHPGLCHKVAGLCFHCRQPGHKVVDCPIKLGRGSQTVQSVIGGSGAASAGAGRGAGRGAAGAGGRSQIGQGSGRGQIGQGSSVSGGQARVYHLTRQEAQTSNAAVTGTLSISGSSAYGII